MVKRSLGALGAIGHPFPAAELPGPITVGNFCTIMHLQQERQQS